MASVRILEDDPAVAHSLRLLLEQHGHTVVCHEDAESFFEAGPPAGSDVVIVDLALPGIGGVEVIRWLGHLDGRPRVIVISGLSQAAIDKMLAEIEMPVVLLRKPLTEIDIATAI